MKISIPHRKNHQLHEPSIFHYKLWLCRLEQKESQLVALTGELASKESELDKVRALVENLETEVKKQNSAAKTLEDDLEAQRSKNNVSPFFFTHRSLHFFHLSRRFFNNKNPILLSNIFNSHQVYYSEKKNSPILTLIFSHS